VRVNFSRKKPLDEIRAIPHVSCNSPKKDRNHKVRTPASEANYHRSDPIQEKICEQRKEGQKPNAFVKIAQEQDCGYAQYKERRNEVERSPAVLRKFLRKIPSVKPVPSDLFQVRAKQQSAMVIDHYIRGV